MTRSQSSRAAALFVGPPLVFLAAITLYPLIFSLWISLRDYSLMRPSESTFVGLKNYLEAFTTSGPRSSLLRSLYFAACSIGLRARSWRSSLPWCSNQDFPGRNVVRAFLMLTWALPDIVNSVLWKWIYNGDLGALNGLLYQLGIIGRYRAWLSDPRIALNLLIASNIWRCAPFVAIILLAGLQSIPDELYEVSRVDGASFMKQFRYFIFPMLRPTILVILVLRSMDALRVFGLVYIVTNGGPGDCNQDNRLLHLPGGIQVAATRIGFRAFVGTVRSSSWSWLSSTSGSSGPQVERAMRSRYDSVQHAPRVRSRLRKLRTLVLLYFLSLLISVVLLAPIAWLVISSVTPRTELASKPPHWLPHQPTLDTYKVLLFGGRSAAIDVGPNFILALRNNIIICAGSAILALALGVPAGYGMSRFRFRGRDTLRLAVVGIRMVPFGVNGHTVLPHLDQGAPVRHDSWG